MVPIASFLQSAKKQLWFSAAPILSFSADFSRGSPCGDFREAIVPRRSGVVDRELPKSGLPGFSRKENENAKSWLPSTTWLLAWAALGCAGDFPSVQARRRETSMPPTLEVVISAA